MSEEQKSLYAQDGVDVIEEADFSKYAASICKTSYENSFFVDVHDLSLGQFRGPRPFSFKNLPEGFFIEASTDGIGTKGIIIDAAKTHADAAYDLIAMTASDITRYGGVPLVFVNALDIVSVGEDNDEARLAYKSVLDGLGKVAKDSNIVILKGETAQMGVCIGSEIADSKTKLNWTGAMIGAYHKDKMITGETIRPGQIILALKENGFRCNGISSLRKALANKFGEQWWKNPEAKKSIKLAATPSVLYDKYVTTLHGWYNSDFKPKVKLHAVVHVSGGAIKEKLAKDILFSQGMGADIDDLWDPPKIMKECAQWRGIKDEEFYETWNGGQGMMLIVDEKDAEKCLNLAKDFGIEAKISGKVTNIPKVKIFSKLSNKEIIYS
jgi:phosphoribosylformylglycinamidine cyclo-ligase